MKFLQTSCVLAVATLMGSVCLAESVPAANVTDVPSQSTKASEKKQTKQASNFKTDEEKLSYIIGHQVATSIRNDDIKINKSALIKALEEGLNGKESSLTPQESQAFMQKYFAQLQKSRGDKNKKDGLTFLNKNKSDKGIVTLADGLQYRVLAEGKGSKPKATDTVSVDYEGTLINGKVFDSSYARKQPATFPVSAVIKGWTEALQLMPEGSTWMLYIPSELAYGDKAPSPNIGPNSSLVFKVHLISIAKVDANAQPKNINNSTQTIKK